MADPELLWTIPGMVEQWSREQPDTKNFLFVNKTGIQSVWTAKDIHTYATRFAARLRNEYGFQPGDIVANALPNSPERLVTDLGVMLAGCATVNCQVVEKDGSDFWNTARLSTCKALILNNRESNPAFVLFSRLVPNLKSVSGLVELTTPQAPNIKKLVVIHRNPNDPSVSLIESLSAENCPSYSHDSDPSDLATLFTTSGSSGFCKLVPRSHEEVMKAGRSFEGAKDITYFNDRPFGWMGGFPFDYLAHCSVRILQDQLDDLHATDALDLWGVLVREQCTGAALLPTQIALVMAAVRDSPPDFKLGFLVTGGQPLKQNLAEAVGVIAHVLVVSYGSTECGMVSLGVVKSLAESKDFFSGKANKGVSIKIIDDLTGKEVETGVTGSIVLKSVIPFRGYFNQPELAVQDAYTEDGWFKTGDLGRLDEDGNLYCIARSGDSVNQGAVLVYCSWPETVLSKCEDILEVSVVKLPGTDQDPEGSLCACVLKSVGSTIDEEGLMRWYKDSFMTSGVENRQTFIPEISRIVFVETMPLTDSGKVSKRELVRTVKKMLDSG